MKNWKTTLLGIITGVAMLVPVGLSARSNPATLANPQTEAQIVAALAAMGRGKVAQDAPSQSTNKTTSGSK